MPHCIINVFIIEHSMFMLGKVIFVKFNDEERTSRTSDLSLTFTNDINCVLKLYKQFKTMY